jgi:hypothetical protein
LTIQSSERKQHPIDWIACTNIAACNASIPLQNYISRSAVDRDATSIEENRAVQEIDKIACRLDAHSNLQDIRRAIAALMLDQLYALQTTPTHWRRAHFANAVAALAMDIHAIQQPTNAWLRLCLVDLRKAVESVQPNTSDTACDCHLGAMTLEELIATVEELYAQP